MEEVPKVELTEKDYESMIQALNNEITLVEREIYPLQKRKEYMEDIRRIRQEELEKMRKK